MLLSRKPELRPSAKELLSHKYYSDIDRDKLLDPEYCGGSYQK